MIEGRIVVLDNGGGFCKAGFAGEDKPTVVVPNCLGRQRSSASSKWLVADQVQQCDDIQGMVLRRPVDRGYLVNTDAEKEVWERIFKGLLKVRPSECGLFLMEPLFNLPAIKKNTDELIFEEFGFQSLYVADVPSMAHIYEAHQRPKSLLAQSDCSLIVDSGFSFTHAAPVFQKFVVNHAVKRINLGGKALTNYLKELVSYRAWNVMDETYLIEDVKEKLCFCSTDVPADLNICRKRGKENFIRSQYVLPDGVKHKRGFVKDLAAASAASAGLENDEEMQATDVAAEDQELTLTNERFLVPEMLFQPADLGMEEAGLSECIVRAISACQPQLQPLLYSSIVLTGGTTQFPNFKDKLESELRALVPDDYQVSVHLSDSPIVAGWRGASLLAATPEFEGCSVSKEEYEESGSLRCRQRFLH